MSVARCASTHSHVCTCALSLLHTLLEREREKERETLTHSLTHSLRERERERKSDSYTLLHTPTLLHSLTHSLTHSSSRAHTYTHTYARAHTHTHTHTRTQVIFRQGTVGREVYLIEQGDVILQLSGAHSQTYPLQSLFICQCTRTLTFQNLSQATGKGAL